MNVNRVPSGDVVVLDANIVLYAIQGASEQCRKILVRCATSDITGVLPMHILAEVMHQANLAEARERGWIKGSNPARQLGEKPDRVRALLRTEEIVHDLLAVGFILESLQREDFTTALGVQKKTGLLTNEALLVAVARRVRATGIVSADQSFANIHGMALYAPDDLPG